MVLGLFFSYNLDPRSVAQINIRAPTATVLVRIYPETCDNLPKDCLTNMSLTNPLTLETVRCSSIVGHDRMSLGPVFYFKEGQVTFDCHYDNPTIVFPGSYSALLIPPFPDASAAIMPLSRPTRPYTSPCTLKRPGPPDTQSQARHSHPGRCTLSPFPAFLAFPTIWTIRTQRC